MRPSLAALHPRETRQACPFLAVRRLGMPGWTIGHCRGLSFSVESRRCRAGPHPKPACCLRHCRLAVARRPEGRLAAWFEPNLMPSERATAQGEGWMLGVAGSARMNDCRYCNDVRILTDATRSFPRFGYRARRYRPTASAQLDRLGCCTRQLRSQCCRTQ